jgi:nicotinamide phosphoribosyltransferase
MNTLLHTDVYKLGHMVQYAPGTTDVYSYLTARSDKNFQKVVFFGLQYYLKKYLAEPLLHSHARELLATYESILGPPSLDVKQKVFDLCTLGYWPLKIRAVPEGTVISPRNVLMTIRNTKPGYHWCVGFVESLLLKVWYPTTVASCCYKYRKLVEKYWDMTVGHRNGIDFAVHDFGYRGDTSEEGAAISGLAHLLSFRGGDTVVAHKFAYDYYCADWKGVMSSVPATEHSVMCSYGRDDELGAFKRMLELHPTGIVSIVSDTFNVYRVLTEFATYLHDDILARDGKVVFRPDSGDPEKIICGDPDAVPGSHEYLGAVRLLDWKFGSKTNALGYRELNPKVGLIYGDGMYYERFERTLARLEKMGYAASNLTIGVGGILRNHTRDTLGFAIKATHVVVDGKHRDIEKDPVTDPGKRSHKGYLRLDHASDVGWITTDQVSEQDECGGELLTVFRDGRMPYVQSLADIRRLVREAV